MENIRSKRMNTRRFWYSLVWVAGISFLIPACIPSFKAQKLTQKVPKTFQTAAPQDSSSNTATIKWRSYFIDSLLVSLIDSAIKNNQGLKIIEQNIIQAQAQIANKTGAYLPFVRGFIGAGMDKTGRYTRQGAIESNTLITPNQPLTPVLGDFAIGANVSWQLDVWKQLRNAKTSAVKRYLSSIDGRNYMVTLLISDVAQTYYELVALDNQLEIIKANIEIQSNALEIIKLQKLAGITTELAVRRFDAEVAKNKSRQYYVQQRIVEAENHINFILGRFPTPVRRKSAGFLSQNPPALASGIPSQLLLNRPDIRKAENELLAADLDIKVARASYYPTVMLTAGLGYQAFNPSFLFSSPESIIMNLAGGLVAPLVNRKAITAEYQSATSRQVQAVVAYEQNVLTAYTEAVNQLSNLSNLSKTLEYKTQQVDALTRSINISISLFKSALADYVEVLLTQRDALEARMELVETKKQQMNASVRMYQILGGGWQ